jgi:DNA-directed RNA polymerase specialized sigma54-like protein
LKSETIRDFLDSKIAPLTKKEIASSTAMNHSIKQWAKKENATKDQNLII